MSRLTELGAAIGSPRAVLRKLRDAFLTVFNLINPWERRRRFANLQARGLMAEAPNSYQLTLGSYHMLTRYLLPSNVQFYEHYDQGHWWQQVLRVLDEPSAMIDPVGIGASKDMVVSHLAQVVHCSAGYDVALLCMFDDGIDTLRVQLRQLRDGTHPRQKGIMAILERQDYPAMLLDALDRFEADPVANWRVDTYPAPEGCDELFDWGIETFGTPGRFFAYCCKLPRAPWAKAPEVEAPAAASESQRLQAA